LSEKENINDKSSLPLPLTSTLPNKGKVHHFPPSPHPKAHPYLALLTPSNSLDEIQKKVV